MYQRTVSIWLWLLLLLLIIPTGLALMAMPFARAQSSLITPILIVTGLVIGAIAQRLMRPIRWWSLPLQIVPLLIGVPFLIAGIIALVTHKGESTVIILNAVTVLFAACLPWFLLLNEPILALVIVWLIVAGSTRFHTATITWQVTSKVAIHIQPTWWLTWLLLISFLLIGVSAQREAVDFWTTRHLKQLGPVFWPAMRSIMLISAVTALVVAIPFGAIKLASLGNLWRQTPLAQGGPLSYDTSQGQPITDFGAPLSFDSVPPTNHSLILTYRLLAGSGPQSLLIGATLDTFDGTTWQQGPLVANTSTTPLLAPAEATAVKARITIVRQPQSSGSLLLGFAQPVTFTGITAQPQTIGTDAPSLLTVAQWHAATADNLTYTSTSAVLPDTTQSVGSLDAPLLKRMTDIPASEATLLRTTAQSWIGAATTDHDKVQALLARFRDKMTLDAGAQPTGDAVAWCITHQRGSVLLVTTTYILLARSLGIPMRLAEGYQAGAFGSSTTSAVNVYDDMATVWSQFAIPGKGWVDISPAAQIIRVVTPSELAKSGNNVPTPTPTVVKMTPTPITNANHPAQPPTIPPAHPISNVIVGIAVLIIALLGIVALVLLQWARYGRRLGPVLQIFARIGLLARLAGVPLRASDTATMATNKVAPLLEAEQRPLFVSFNQLYEEQVYGKRTGSLVTQLNILWGQFRMQFVKTIVQRRLHR